MVSSYQIIDLGISPYEETWRLQKELQSKRILGEIDDQLLLVEHHPVYTLGKNAPSEHLLFGINEGVSIVRSDRGGKITFHGPGQLVGYPILDLNQYKKSISWYMRKLEKLIITILDEYDIKASRKKGLTGVWVKDKKIAALGVRISRWVTMHGFSINIDPDLEYYKGIIPCGISDYGITSMARLLDSECPNISEIKKITVKHFTSQFLTYKTKCLN